VSAIDWLGSKEEKKAVVRLTEMMQQDKRIAVRAHAASSIGLIAEKDSMKPLIEHIVKESSPVVRYSMVLAMARIGIESKEQYDALMQIKQSETDPYIKDFIEKMEAKFKN
jgi:HEAT repeat protein